MEDDYPTEKNGLKVFSCFACGGGSTMGYKLAGFDVIGCNEIDPKMNKVYVANHNPKFNYLEGIQTFKLRDNLPEELYNLDILDGSPPCSSFSMAGNREKDWGKEKKFKEGQAEQVLDTLFFDFIDLAEKLKPKVVIAENVKGLLMGEAQKYVNKILQAFEKAGYYVRYDLLDASKMGVPQKRQRVFFSAIRKDLYKGHFDDLFQSVPGLKLDFNENGVPYSQIEDLNSLDGEYRVKPSVQKLWKKVIKGDSFNTVHPRKMLFSCYKTDPKKPLNTILSGEKARDGAFNHRVCRSLTKSEIIKGQSFPSDYNFCELKSNYICGMSVPPLMTARIANEVKEQWLDKV
jgi:DNA (cytosine-5)-methyltransferase 1